MMFNLIDRSNDPEHISKIHDIYFTMIQSNVGEKERRIRRKRVSLEIFPTCLTLSTRFLDFFTVRFNILILRIRD